MKRVAALLIVLIAGCAHPASDVELYRSRTAFLQSETDAFLRKHEVEDLAALADVWQEVGKNYPTPRTKAGPLLQTALVEIARNRAEKLYRASLPYGKASSPQDGAYYLAQAEASRAFADSIVIAGKAEAPPDREQIRAALLALEREAYQRYEHDPSRRSLVFNAKLKEARDLLDRGSLAGATLTLMELRTAAVSAADVAASRRYGSTLREVFRNQPAALSLLDSMTSHKLPAARSANGIVTVTLIRWPYTCGLSDPATLLARETARRYGSQVRFVIENFGASPLAERFGVDKYPAVFVDDVLVAGPEDFYAWGGADSGRYVPWGDPVQREEFQHDLMRMIDLRLAGAVNLSL